MSGPWWWCLDHAEVESQAGCRNAVRLGPFESAESAAHALELAHRRTEEWDHADDWPEDGEADA
jgi:hypothetical protein